MVSTSANKMNHIAPEGNKRFFGSYGFMFMALWLSLRARALWLCLVQARCALDWECALNKSAGLRGICARNIPEIFVKM